MCLGILWLAVLQGVGIWWCRAKCSFKALLLFLLESLFEEVDQTDMPYLINNNTLAFGVPGCKCFLVSKAHLICSLLFFFCLCYLQVLCSCDMQMELNFLRCYFGVDWNFILCLKIVCVYARSIMNLGLKKALKWKLEKCVKFVFLCYQ